MNERYLPAAQRPAMPCASQAAPGVPVPVLRPLLPPADRVLPYLRRIDATRTYTNFGPLTLEFESRLADAFGAKQGEVASAATGTAGLVGAILASAGRASAARPLALIPAYSFVATAVAAEQCGYQPHFVDVAIEDWSLAPAHLLDHPALGRAGLVLPVAPFGIAPETSAWRAFRDRTDIPVVVDAAASFESVAGSPGVHAHVPVVLSLHATKSFGIGEGGCVLCENAEQAAQVTQALNFGFREARDSRCASSNGKLSEYHAAVGLAELDGWGGKQQAYADALAAYRDAFAAQGLGGRLIAAPRIASCYVLLDIGQESRLPAVVASLAADNIGFRRWYGDGLHRQPYFASRARDPLPVTDAIAARLLGLPMACDLEAGAMVRVAAAVRAGLADA